MFNFIKTLCKNTFDVCLLRKGPEDFPASQNLLLWLVVVSFLATWLALLAVKGVFRGGVDAVINVAVPLIFTRSLLIIIKKRERFIQSALALLSTNLLISLLGLAFLLILQMLGAVMGGFVTPFYSVGVSLVFTWILLVQGHIFRQAMDKSFWIGILIAILLMFFNGAVLELANRLFTVSPL